MKPSLSSIDSASPTTVRSWLQKMWHFARPWVGWSFICIGILGCLLPVLPGLPFLFIGVALVGRRTWVIRWCAVQYKLFVRRWAMLPHPLVARMGRLALLAQQETSRQRRRLYWWHQERQRASS